MPTQREEFVWYAKQWLGTWYKWAGDDPHGFDCSGYTIECLKAFGKFPRKEDATANDLKIRFKNQEVQGPAAGVLVFWCKPGGQAFHIEIAINEWQSIGASGGGSQTLTTEDAIRDNAFIKIRPIFSRAGLMFFADPFKGV